MRMEFVLQSAVRQFADSWSFPPDFPMTFQVPNMFNKSPAVLVSLALGCLAFPVTGDGWTQDPAQGVVASSVTDNGAEAETRFLSDSRQVTFDGLRSGEGYFSADGTKMVFQSEREQGNPFYQIYLLDFDTGETERVSPGMGTTTCAWIHPDGRHVLFASTHEDPDAKKKQEDLLRLRAEGNEPRYSWNYDEHYELYERDLETGDLRRMTDARGYDAEGSYSPDGKLVAFASNRATWTRELTDREKEITANDASYMMDIYIMNTDGTGLKQLTDAPGYDGGPFFSHDGKKICWRRFSEDGARAEIFSMDIDGSNQRQLTRMNVMSWAPYFHPSGEYLVFTTNKHGMANFELYLVDANGKSEPVRVTGTDGFDGLASFTPDGKQLTWTSNRNKNQSQIYLAGWDHEAARKALGLDRDVVDTADIALAESTGKVAAATTSPDFRGLDMMKHVDFLCHPRLAGRMTGSPGEREATAYVAAYLDSFGLVPAGDNGTWYQEFEFPAGAEMGPENKLSGVDRKYLLDKDWRPLTFTKSGEFDSAAVVWAGYAITAPAEEGQEEYDSFVHLDVKDKWVLALRYMPENTSVERRQFLQFHSNLRKKAMDVRDRGAKGIIFVSGPTSMAREQLVPQEKDSSLAGTSIAVLSVTDEVAGEWLKSAGKDLKTLQESLDSGDPAMGFAIPGIALSANISVIQKTGRGRNVVGRLQAGDKPALFGAVVVGAHIDHLGSGRSSGSLARQDEESMIHFGADDNASGVSAMLEVAEYLARQKSEGKLKMKRDVIFAAWSGEELGLFGSAHYVESVKQFMDAFHPPAATAASSAGEKKAPENQDISPLIGACLNMDMVGRYNGSLILQGIGSSPDWKSAAELNATIGLNLKLSDDVNLPTDASSFYRAGVPILSAFTGSHTDYHTPRDTPDKLNYEDAAKIARLMGLITRKLAAGEKMPAYVKQEQVAEDTPRVSMQVYLGTLPNYSGGILGTLLDDVTRGSPADQAGLKPGDIVVELAGRKIDNVNEYSLMLGVLKPGQETTIVVKRGEQELKLKLVPGRR